MYERTRDGLRAARENYIVLPTSSESFKDFSMPVFPSVFSLLQGRLIDLYGRSSDAFKHPLE
ncbi:hypothetical protein DPMN_103939 [Dreissena polymorpha]|uniref:Uncharacterized protein n=1 Tax=Dreissena polymorpha TaxID=45954 RepID=A0A9D4H8T9_DREPO|nr:hypothetical protein DPMN_103939 [Dreissena polymorpha]